MAPPISISGVATFLLIEKKGCGLVKSGRVLGTIDTPGPPCESSGPERVAMVPGMLNYYAKADSSSSLQVHSTCCSVPVPLNVSLALPLTSSALTLPCLVLKTAPCLHQHQKRKRERHWQGEEGRA